MRWYGVAMSAPKNIVAVTFCSTPSFGDSSLTVPVKADSITASALGIDIVRSSGPMTRRQTSHHFVPWSNVADVKYAVEAKPEQKAKAA
jgi:hypothetical protein